MTYHTTHHVSFLPTHQVLFNNGIIHSTSPATLVDPFSTPLTQSPTKARKSRISFPFISKFTKIYASWRALLPMPSNEQISVFFFTYISYCSLYGTRKPFSVVKAYLKEQLNLSTYALGAIDTGFLTSYALGQLVLPSACQRYAKPPLILLFAFLGSCCCAMIFGSSSSSIVMLFAWTINGCLHSVVYPILVTSLAVWFSPSVRGQVLGSWTTSQQTGSFLSTGFAAFAASHYGWRSTFYIPGVLVGFIGVVIFICLPNPPTQKTQLQPPTDVLPSTPKPSEKTKESKGSGTEIELTDIQSMAIKVFKNNCEGIQKEGLMERTRKAVTEQQLNEAADKSESSVIDGDVNASNGTSNNNSNDKILSLFEVLEITDLKNVAASYFFVKCVRYSLLFWLPFYLRNGLGYEASTSGYSSMMFDLGGIPGAVFSGFISDRVLKGRRLITACIMTFFAAISISLFSYATTFGYHVTIAFLLLVGFSVAGPDSILGAAAAQDLCDRSPHGSRVIAAAAGVVNGMGSCGAVMQGFLTATISERYGWQFLFGTLSVFLLISIAMLYKPMQNERLHWLNVNRSKGTTPSTKEESLRSE